MSDFHHIPPLISFDPINLAASLSHLKTKEKRKQLSALLRKEITTGNLAHVQSIIQACSTNHEKLELIKEKDSEGRNALMIAAYYGNKACIDAILNVYSDKMKALTASYHTGIYEQSGNSEKKITVLMYVASIGSVASIEAILSFYPGSKKRLEALKKMDDDGMTALMHAAESGNVDALNVILKAYPEIQDQKNALQGNKQATALMVATENSNIDCMKAILEKIPQIKLTLLSQKDKQGRNILMIAAQTANLECINTILKASPEYNMDFLKEKDSKNKTALMIATELDATDGIKDMLKSVSSEQKIELLSERFDHGNTVLTMAVINGTHIEQYGLKKLDFSPHERITVGNIYLSDEGKYYFESANGQLYTGNLKKDVDFNMDNFENKLNNPAFKKSILEIISKKSIRAILETCPVESRLALLTMENHEGLNAFQLSTQGIHNFCMRAILNYLSEEHKIVLLSEKDNNNETILHRCAKNNNPSCVKIILEACPKEHLSSLLNAQNSFGRTALIIAAKSDCLDNVKSILSVELSDENRHILLNARDQVQATALMYASMCTVNGREIMEDILDAYDSYEEKTKALKLMMVNMTPLMIASQHASRVEYIRALLAVFPDSHKIEFLNKQNSKNGMTALMYAAGNFNAEGLKVMLRNYQKPEDKMDALRMRNTVGLTAFMIALKRGDNDSIKEILDKCPREHVLELLHMRDPNNSTALIMALKFSRIDSVKLILKKTPGNNKLDLLTQRASNNASALMMAATRSQVDFIEMILDAYSNREKLNELIISTTDAAEYTALTVAAGRGNVAVIQKIMQFFTPGQYADFFAAANNQGERAIAIAERKSHSDVVRFLRNLIPFPLNHQQNTHTFSVHDSSARSAISLVALYIPYLSEEDKLDLSKWVKSRPAALDEQEIKKKVHDIMMRLTEQGHIVEFIEYHQQAILYWANSLRHSDSDKNKAAERAVQRIYTDYSTWIEPNSQITLPLALSLVWHALNQDSYTIEEKKTRHEALMEHLHQTSREGNFNSKDIDVTPNSEDRPACAPGTFNNLLQVLSGGLHPTGGLLMVGEANVTHTTIAAILSLLNLKNYSESEITDLKNNFIENEEEENESVPSYTLPNSIIEKIQEKLILEVESEYHDHIQGGYISHGKVIETVNKVLRYSTQDLSACIVKKINAYTEEADAKRRRTQDYSDSSLSSSSSDIRNPPITSFMFATGNIWRLVPYTSEREEPKKDSDSKKHKG